MSRFTAVGWERSEVLATRCLRLSAIAFLSAPDMSEADRGPQASDAMIAPVIPNEANGRKPPGQRSEVKPLMSERYSGRQTTAPSRNGDNLCLSVVTSPLKTP